MRINFNPILKFNNQPLKQTFKGSYGVENPYDIFIKNHKEEEISESRDFADELYQVITEGYDVPPEVERMLRDNISAYLWLESAGFAKRLILDGRLSIEKYNEISLADFDNQAKTKILEALKTSRIETPQDFANLEKVYNDIKSQNKSLEKMGLDIINLYGILDNPKEYGIVFY